jgi:hypothetical protein
MECIEAKVTAIVPTVYGYTRPIFSGPSSASQKAEIESYFARLQPEGFAYGGCFSDPPDSGRVHLVEREAGRELDRRLKPGDQVVFSTLLVWSRPMDFSRTAEAWMQRGIGIHVISVGVDSRTEKGKLGIRVVQVCAEAFDNVLPREQACASVAKKRRLRKALNGNPPLGFKLVGPKDHRRCVPDSKEREVMGRILGWHKEGHSTDWIYFALIRDRVRTREGREWGRTRIWEAIRAKRKLRDGS